ncbi:hypothetical protein ACKLNR_014539 [Fusarium oxysporum f. sp. zingiberi]|uniref:Uncharacterized protein n=1 Tax=Fusarium oxysporum f. sp. melonis 26406 TaxID=1089452 RepID=W9ZFF5_FUSOX|nr:hypothetical protein FOMG_16436 [Fusarium oxysporum f. sp. melonis 26406]KAH7215409.1 hypothetical protein DER44DRAFT_764276 [Fusarium oxysporum]
MVVSQDFVSQQEPPPSSERKRRRLSIPNTSSTDNVQHPCKRRVAATTSTRFWDNLSKQHLTKNALEELDERNAREKQSGLPVQHTTEAVTPVNHYLRQCTPARLKDIQDFAQSGSINLTDLRGYRGLPLKSWMSSSQSGLGRRKRGSQSPSKKSTTTNTTKSGPYDRNFQQNLVDHGIYPDKYLYPDLQRPPKPGNLEELRGILKQRRRSLSPSVFPEDKFEVFQDADAHASKESQIIADVIPTIEGDIHDRRCVGRQIPFTGLDQLTDGTLVPGNPDLYYGARPEQLHRKVRRELKGKIIPSTQQDLPIAPNFFLAVKGPDGSLSVASRQACYDGALGARGILSLQSYCCEDHQQQYDNDAYTLTSIYHGGQLKMYTMHPIPPSTANARPQYIMTLVKAWVLTSDVDAFREGVAAFRNGRDWTMQQRDEAIRRANEKVSEAAYMSDLASFHGSGGTVDATGSDALVSLNDSDTSTDELSQEFHPPKRTCSPQKQPHCQPSGELQANSVADAHTLSSTAFKDGKQFGVYLQGPGEK